MGGRLGSADKRRVHELDEPDGHRRRGRKFASAGTAASPVNQIPGALIRGGAWGDGASAGVFAAATGWGHDGDAGGRRAASAWHSATTTRHDHGVARARTGEHAGVESEGIAHEGDRQHAPVVDGAGPDSLLSHLFREE